MILFTDITIHKLLVSDNIFGCSEKSRIECGKKIERQLWSPNGKTLIGIHRRYEYASGGPVWYTAADCHAETDAGTTRVFRSG